MSKTKTTKRKRTRRAGIITAEVRRCTAADGQTVYLVTLDPSANNGKGVTRRDLLNAAQVAEYAEAYLTEPKA